MESIEINVSKQMDGYTFCILPSVRRLIRSLSPDFRPANTIFVSYDTQSEFEYNYSIFLALLGINCQNDLANKVDEIKFIESKTGNILHSHKITA